MLKLLPTCTLLLLTATAASAQGFTIDVSPPEQTIGIGTTASYSITAVPNGGFLASVFLRVIAPTLNPTTVTLEPTRINAPYTSAATLTIAPAGGDAGTHTIVIEGKNGAVASYDTVRLTVTSDPNMDQWTIYHTGNSQLQSMSVSAIEFDKTGAAWIGTDKGILRALPGEAPQLMTGPLENARIKAIGVDSAGAVWGGGVTRYVDNGWFTHTAPDEVRHTSIEAIATAPDGSVWFGGHGGLHRRSGSTWTHFAPDDWGGVIGNDVGDLAVTPDGVLWASSGRSSIETEQGVLKFDGTFWTGFSREEMGINLASIAIGDSGRVWIASEDNAIVSPSGPGIIRRAIPFDVTHVASARDGRLWISTSYSSSGPRLAVDVGGTWKEIDMTSSGIPEDVRIEELAVHDNGTVWIGTDAHGLIVLRPANGTVGVAENQDAVASGPLALIPNPVGSTGTLQLQTKGGPATITLYDNLGARMSVLFEGTLQPGAQSLPIDLTGVPAGAYLLTVSVEGSVPSSRMIVVAR